MTPADRATTRGLARSVQTRLVRHAHARGIDPNVVLARYAAERLLYRLSRSPHAERFVLKGALMLLVSGSRGHRPRRPVRPGLGAGRAMDATVRSVEAHEPGAQEIGPGARRQRRLRVLREAGPASRSLWLQPRISGQDPPRPAAGAHRQLSGEAATLTGRFAGRQDPDRGNDRLERWPWALTRSRGAAR
jgi:hypothetical protein